MNFMIPVRDDGSVEPRFGRAPKVAVATVDDSGSITGWQTFDVQWDRLHDEGPEGSHHARICLLYTSPSPRDATLSRMPSSA